MNFSMPRQSNPNIRVQENFTPEYLNSHVQHGIPSILNGHGHEALDILEPLAIKRSFILHKQL